MLTVELNQQEEHEILANINDFDEQLRELLASFSTVEEFEKRLENFENLMLKKYSSIVDYISAERNINSEKYSALQTVIATGAIEQEKFELVEFLLKRGKVDPTHCMMGLVGKLQILSLGKSGIAINRIKADIDEDNMAPDLIEKTKKRNNKAIEDFAKMTRRNAKNDLIKTLQMHINLAGLTQQLINTNKDEPTEIFLVFFMPIPQATIFFVILTELVLARNLPITLLVECLDKLDIQLEPKVFNHSEHASIWADALKLQKEQQMKKEKIASLEKPLFDVIDELQLFPKEITKDLILGYMKDDIGLDKAKLPKPKASEYMPAGLSKQVQRMFSDGPQRMMTRGYEKRLELEETLEKQRERFTSRKKMTRSSTAILQRKEDRMKQRAGLDSSYGESPASNKKRKRRG